MNTQQTPPMLLSARAVARRLGVSITWVESEAAEGRLPHITVGRRRLFLLDVVREALVERSRQAPTPTTAQTDADEPGGES